VGDFNRDGHLDLAVANSGSSSVSVFLGNGDGSFQNAQNYLVGSNPVSVVVTDLNGDGIPDLAVLNRGSDPDYQGTVSILLGNGDGTFQAAQSFSVGVGVQSMAIGDFNGDGHPDLAVIRFPSSNGGTAATILLGNGDGSFQAPLNQVIGGYPICLGVGDVNGDGMLDLVFASDGSVSVLLGHGDGTFESPKTFAGGRGPHSVAVADLNGDGKADIVTTNYLAEPGPHGFWYTVESDALVFLGNGDGTFQTPQSYGTGSNSVAIADFNGDGILDLALARGPSILLGNGDGTFKAPQIYFPNGPSVAAGDFNADGFPDLAVLSFYGGGVTILLNDTHWGP
jgi:hypothetical protein